jgi:putative transposase
MVRDLKAQRDVEISLSCTTLGVSRGGYYAWLDRPQSSHELANEALLVRMRAIHEKTKQTYGAPRMTAELQADGILCSKNRVAKLMRENGIASEAVRKFKVTTTDSNHDLPIAERIYKTESVENVWTPNQVFAGDITYVATEEGFLFLAVFLDIFTRKIVGFSADDNMRTQLILDALNMALTQQDVVPGETIAHSDQGSQYASEEYRTRVNFVGIIASMSRRGNCYDNAHCESFFHSLKTELVYRTFFKTREEAKQAIYQWIETWYNRQRRHSALDYMSPVDFEKLALAA